MPVWISRSGKCDKQGIADNPATATVINQRRMTLPETRHQVSFHGLSQQLTRPSSQDFRQRVILKIRWVPKGNNGILLHGVSFLGLGQVVTATIARIRLMPLSNAVHKIQAIAQSTAVSDPVGEGGIRACPPSTGPNLQRIRMTPAGAIVPAARRAGTETVLPL